MKYFLLLCFLVSLSLKAHASNEAYLDSAYKNLQHPQLAVDFLEANTVLPQATKSDVLSLAAKQTAVKDQSHRGTCSIFSATALLESMLVIANIESKEINLSEEWLQYLVSQTTTSDGSTSPANFQAFKNSGATTEEKLPYIGEEWEDARSGEAQKRCTGLQSSNLKKCLNGHRNPALLRLSEAELSNPNSTNYDPEFLAARKDSVARKAKYFHGGAWGKTVTNVTEIKSLLSKGTPLTLDLDFYYGAWNHRKSEELGIDRNLDHWKKGIVAYPEADSADRLNSGKAPAGHSVVVIGYDDSIEIEYTMNMRDGKKQTFKRKGVYIFKNSWGTGSFGPDFVYDGKSLPGYGMILEDYAHEYGQFFQFSL